MVFASSVLKVLLKAIAQNIGSENFHDLSKIHKTFLSLHFVVYGIWYKIPLAGDDLLLVGVPHNSQ